jgi:hypothetical protein
MTTAPDMLHRRADAWGPAWLGALAFALAMQVACLRCIARRAERSPCGRRRR